MQQNRRDFLALSGALACGALAISPAATQVRWEERTFPAALPRRRLGKTDAVVPMLTLGTAPLRFLPQATAADASRLVGAALDLGVDAIDTAPRFGSAEAGIGRALGAARRKVFLIDRIFADTPEEAERQLAASLRTLRTDHVDLLCLENLGRADVRRATETHSVFTWLMRQKQRGTAQTIGLTAENLSERIPPLLATGQIDALLLVLNFVDRHNYAFERAILPLAARHGVGVVATKVYGGVRRSLAASYFGGLASPAPAAAPRPQLDESLRELAVRYTLGLPGVASASIGVQNVEELRQNADRVRRYRSLSDEERSLAIEIGRRLAPRWQPQFGPAGLAELA